MLQAYQLRLVRPCLKDVSSAASLLEKFVLQTVNLNSRSFLSLLLSPASGIRALPIRFQSASRSGRRYARLMEAESSQGLFTVSHSIDRTARDSQTRPLRRCLRFTKTNRTLFSARFCGICRFLMDAWKAGCRDSGLLLELTQHGLGYDNFKGFTSSASARLYLKQVHCFGKQRVGHAGEVTVLSERTRLLHFRMFFNVSICFHAEASSKNPTREGAHSLHCRRRYYNNRITLLTGLVCSLPYVGRGIKLCNEVQDTAPEFLGFGISFTSDAS